MRSNLIAGLDIGTSKTCAVIGEIIGDLRRPGLTILGVGQARTAGVRGDIVTNIEEITESVRSSLKEAELMAGVSVDRVMLAWVVTMLGPRVLWGSSRYRKTRLRWMM